MWFVAHWTWSVKFHGGENAHTPSDFHTFTLSNMKHLTFHFKIYQNICLWSLFDYPLIHFTCTSSFCVLLNVLQSKLSNEMLSIIHAHITAGATVLHALKKGMTSPSQHRYFSVMKCYIGPNVEYVVSSWRCGFGIGLFRSVVTTNVHWCLLWSTHKHDCYLCVSGSMHQVMWCCAL